MSGICWRNWCCSIISVALLVGLVSAMAFAEDTRALRQIQMDKQVFNPSEGDSIWISYTLEQPAQVTLLLCDPDGRVVRRLVENADLPKGLHRAQWDGKDDVGDIVPDEAYHPLFQVDPEVGLPFELDPTQNSGGEQLGAIEAQYDAIAQELRYVLPVSARVRIMAGVADGPLLALLASNEPRVAGLQVEPWDGMDTSGIVKVVDLPDWRVRVDAYLLPDLAIIAQGNGTESYKDYTLRKLSDGERMPAGYELLQMKRKPRLAADVRLSNFASQSRMLDQPPVFEVAPVSGERSKGLPMLKGMAEFDVTLDPLTNALLNEVRFEVVYFLNFERLGEEEQAYSPMRFSIPTESYEDGVYYLTVNVASLTGQLSSRTLEVVIEN